MPCINNHIPIMAIERNSNNNLEKTNENILLTPCLKVLDCKIYNGKYNSYT